MQTQLNTEARRYISIAPKSTRGAKSYSPDRVKGGLLAIQMFEEIAGKGAEICQQSDRFRKRGTPQDNVVARYLPQLTTPDMIEGFTAVLTEQLSHGFDDSFPCLAYVELLAKYPPAIAQRKWDGSVGRRSRRLFARHRQTSGLIHG